MRSIFLYRIISKIFSIKQKRHCTSCNVFLNAGDGHRAIPLLFGTKKIHCTFVQCLFFVPATGIEPVREYKSRRILSPVRLPVPPRRHSMDGGGFEPPKQYAADLQSVPFGHSGIHPFIQLGHQTTVCHYISTSTKLQVIFT